MSGHGSELARLDSAARFGMATSRERGWPALPEPQGVMAVRDRLARAAGPWGAGA